MVSLERCEFKANYFGNGEEKFVGHIPYSNEACLQKVLEEYPNANGVSLYWREPRWRYDALCYASFGNKLIFEGQGFYGCMFHESSAKASARCNDGIKNGPEVDVDCGGDCSACANCVWEAIPRNECPARPAKLDKCTQNTKHGELCEASSPFPKGMDKPAMYLNNCQPGGWDVFRCSKQ